MPAVYEGTTTPPVSTTTWAATTGYTAGEYVQPSPATGQYFQCTGSGTSSGSQPAWSNPASLPVPGTTFVDGSVTWSCMGSIFVPGTGPSLDTPLDSDPPGTTVIDRALRTIANYLAGAGYLAADQTWTGENAFSAPSSFGGLVTFTDYTATDEAEFFTVDPSTNEYALITTWRIGNVSGTPIYARLYAANNGLTTAFLGITVNAAWNGTGWQYDDSIRPATLFEFQSYGLQVLNFPASGSSPWLYSAWVQGLQLLSPLSVGTGLTITTGGKITQIAAQATAGQVGVPGVLASSGLVAGIVSSGATSMLSYALPVTGLYRLSVYTKQTSGSAYSGGAPFGVVSYPGGNSGWADSGVAGSPWAAVATDGSSFLTWDASVIFKSAAGAMTFTLQAPATGNWEGWAVLELVA